MPDPLLYDQLDSVSRMGFLNRELPEHFPARLNPRFELHPYQVEEFARFLHCMGSDYPGWVGRVSPLLCFYKIISYIGIQFSEQHRSELPGTGR